MGHRDQADLVKPEERDEGWGWIFTYRKWLLDKIFKEGNIVVLPVDEGKPNYRENPPPYVADDNAITHILCTNEPPHDTVR